MYKNNKYGFTLVELLAVIVILAIILVIAVPKVMDIITDSKKATLESTAKMIASAAEKAKVQNTVLSKDKEIYCNDIVKLNGIDYDKCIIEFDENNKALVTIKGAGKFERLNVCSGDKTNATAANDACNVSYGKVSTYIEKLEAFNGSVNGLIVDETEDENIRYAGATADVKNKVYFNCAETDGTNAYGSENYNYDSSCEIWRIIGLLDTKTTDNDEENSVKRIKIVRDEVLSSKFEWDTSSDGIGCVNQWGETTMADGTTPYAGASLMQYLNIGDSSYYNSLSSIAKSQIADALWNIGALEYVSDITPEQAYQKELGAETGSEIKINYTTKWIGKIGLIYPSDYGFAGEGCTNIRIKSCGTQNWLNIDSYYWVLSPRTLSSIDSWVVNPEGRITYSNVYNKRLVRPCLYLKSSIQIIGGNGDTEPYKLAI